MRRLVLLSRVLVVIAAAPVAAQSSSGAGATTLADATDAGLGGWVRAKGSAAGTLRRTVALDLRSATIAEALDAISRRAELRIVYGPDVLATPGRVSLHVENMTVADALDAALEGTGLEAYVSLHGTAVLIRRESRVRSALVAQTGGMINGRVTDAVTRAPLDEVAVRVEGPGLGAVTASDGRYVIRSVPSGTYRVTARRVGYTPLTKTVAVVTDSAAMADFALQAAPSKLNEVVTTAVGDQRRYEVGNTISTINADSITPTAPITSLTDLISARAPGVAVEETGGLTGSGEAIRIRGQSSLVLQGDPIIIVDGVRQDNTPGSSALLPVLVSTGVPTVVPAPSRLNDLDFADIQSIDVLKGPAASTEYGTDAANGVIVITTKRGTAGKPQWQASAEGTASAIPEAFPTLYYSWGHTTDPSHTPVRCPLVPYLFSGGHGSATGTCVVDSLTAWNPLNHPYYSIFGSGKRQKYDLSVSGGSDATRYFISGALSKETGVLRLPGVFAAQATTLGLPHSVFDPNGLDQRSVRGNTAIRVGPTADLTLTGAYLSTYQEAVNADNLYLGTAFSLPLRDSAHAYGYSRFSTLTRPIPQFGMPTNQTTGRLTGGMTGNWRPWVWLAGHATLGIDHGSQRSQSAVLPEVAPLLPFYFSTQLGIANTTTDVYTVDVRESATAALTRAVRAVTSIGLQLADTRLQGTTVRATGIPATNFTLNGVVNPTVTQLGDRQATLGGYGEEELGLSDRLFLTGALRVDAGSGFGHAYSTAVYPKASISWLATNSGPATVRLRGAFGESGVQPPNGAALQLYAATTEWLNGGVTSATQIANIQNQVLQPERSEELEGGLDVGLWQNRATVELTGYSKTTRRALVNVGTGWEGGNLPYAENIGEVRNTGVEAAVTTTVLQSRALTWDLSLNGSVNHNTLLSLAPGVLSQQLMGLYAVYQFAPKYPLYGYWGPRVQYTDLNHDGIIEPTEVTVADSLSYTGTSVPMREASLGTHVGLWGGAVSASALVDYRGGFRLLNTSAFYEAISPQSDRASNIRTAPLWQQARDVAAQAVTVTGIDGGVPPTGFYEDATYLRFRELSLTYAVPRAATRALHVRNLSLTGAVRNLALWTRYTGVDPEVATSAGYNAQLSPTSNTSIVNNNMREDAGAVPLLRYWVLRLNAGF